MSESIESMMRQAFDAGANSVCIFKHADFDYRAVVSSHRDERDDDGRSMHASASAHGEGPTEQKALADALGKLRGPAQIQEARDRGRQSALARKKAYVQLEGAHGVLVPQERKTS